MVEKQDRREASIRARAVEIEREISTLLGLNVDVSSARAMVRLEEKVDALEKETLVMAEKLGLQGQNQRPFEGIFELAMNSFKSNCNIIHNNDLGGRECAQTDVFGALDR